MFLFTQEERDIYISDSANNKRLGAKTLCRRYKGNMIKIAGTMNVRRQNIITRLTPAIALDSVKIVENVTNVRHSIYNPVFFSLLNYD